MLELPGSRQSSRNAETLTTGAGNDESRGGNDKDRIHGSSGNGASRRQGSEVHEPLFVGLNARRVVLQPAPWPCPSLCGESLQSLFGLSVIGQVAERIAIRLHRAH